MKKFVLKSLILISSLLGFCGCSNNNSFHFQINSIVNKPLENVEINLYDLNNNFIKSNKTNSKGESNIKLNDGEYIVKLDNLPLGHYQKDEIRFNTNDKDLSIKVPTKVIEETMPNDILYSVNDIVYDYSFIDCDDVNHSIKEVFETKKLLLINFWATWCGPCFDEFPFMEKAYEKYLDKVEIFAFSYSDSKSQVKNYKTQNELQFVMAKDETLYKAFGVNNLPTTAIINQYGIITYIDVGSIVSEKEFTNLFDKYLDENYDYSGDDVDHDDEREIPDVTMPSSSEIEHIINGENFNSHYENETDPEDAKYNWPWIISKTNDSIQPSNSYHKNSYSIIYTSVTLNENEVFAFDYFANSEYQGDILYVLIDRKIVAEISGYSEEFETCYCYSPLEESTHEVAFCYIKNSDYDAELDLVYIKNLRVINKDKITTPTYLFTYAFYNYDASQNKYNSFVDIVYNNNDGYYHVNNANGAILLANLISGSDFSNKSIYEYLGYGDANEIDKNYRNELSKYISLISNYSSYQNNSKVGAVPVTEELKNALIDIVRVVSNKYENEWMLLCGFYKAFACEELSDPIKGLAPFSAYKGQEGINSVNIDRLLMPRGLLTEFIPTESSVYHIYSITYQDVYLVETACWIYDENYRLLQEADFGDRYYSMCEEPDPNFSIRQYMEKGHKYYINVAFANLDYFGDIVFAIENLNVQEFSYLSLCSPNYFTTTLTPDGGLGEIINGGIDVGLGDDGYYHEIKSDGSLGSLIYADFFYGTGIFVSGLNVLSINNLISMGAFNFSYDDEDNPTSGIDKTSEIQQYVSKVYRSGELSGLALVDETLASLLQELMDKYTFKVQNSWVKLCYYYKVIEK